MDMINGKFRPVINEKVLKKRAERKFHIPVLAYTPNGDVERYGSILEAESILGVSYHLIFDAAIGKIRSAGFRYWEYEDGKDWLKYRAKYIRDVRKYTRYINFNG